MISFVSQHYRFILSNQVLKLSFSIEDRCENQVSIAIVIWGGELDIDADENSIAYELAAGVLENGSDSDLDLVHGVGFGSGVSGLRRHIFRVSTETTLTQMQ